MSDEPNAAKERKAHHFKPGAENPRFTMPDRSGRQAGTPNKLTNVKHAVLAAFDKAGGEAYLLKMARSKKPATRALFVQLLAKTIPQEVTGKDGGPIEIHVLQVAKEGLARLSDERLQLFYEILVEIGVYDVVLPSFGEEREVLSLPAPAQGEGQGASA